MKRGTWDSAQPCHLASKHGLYRQDESEQTRCGIVEETFADAQNVLRPGNEKTRKHPHLDAAII